MADSTPQDGSRLGKVAFSDGVAPGSSSATRIDHGILPPADTFLHVLRHVAEFQLRPIAIEEP